MAEVGRAGPARERLPCAVLPHVACCLTASTSACVRRRVHRIADHHGREAGEGHGWCVTGLRDWPARLACVSRLRPVSPCVRSSRTAPLLRPRFLRRVCRAKAVGAGARRGAAGGWLVRAEQARAQTHPHTLTNVPGARRMHGLPLAHTLRGRAHVLPPAPPPARPHSLRSRSRADPVLSGQRSRA